MSMKGKPGCCASVLRTRLGQDDAEELATAFKAIADPGRLRLLSFIATQRDAEACVCHLIEPLGLSQPTVSHSAHEQMTSVRRLAHCASLPEHPTPSGLSWVLAITTRTQPRV